MKVLIVGGVAGGASAAARLRRLDENAQIIIFEKGQHISYANCGLPYYIGNIITEEEKLFLQTPESMKEKFNIDVRVNNEVTAIHPGKREIEVLNTDSGEKYSETYDKLVLAPGSVPIRPKIPGVDDERIFTLKNVSDTFAITEYIDKKKPGEALVVGGGYIGVEMAENLKHRGINVSIIELSNQVIGPIDPDMAAVVHMKLKSKGVGLILEDGVKSFSQSDTRLEVELNSGRKINTDMVLLAVGVKPDVSLAREAGLKIGSLGGILVDRQMRTSDENIFAVGDAVEVVDLVNNNPALIPLAGPANKQGRVAANNIAGKEDSCKGTLGNAIIKVFDMTVAAVGNSEKTLKKYGIEYMKIYIHPPSHAGYYPDAVPMHFKLIFSPKDGKILGAQIVGYEGADKRIDVIATSIKAGMTVYDLQELELAYAPPYSSAKDPVNMAGYVASNVMEGIYEITHWDEIAKNKDLAIIDVRTPVEFNMGHVDGAVNIPVEQLRQRLNEVPRDKQVAVYCQVGIRGYQAYRILKQNGFDNVKDVNGGYKTYLTTKEEYSIEDVEKDSDVISNNDSRASGCTDEDCNITANIKLDACGLQCPGPIMKVSGTISDMNPGDIVEIRATDPAFVNDIRAWCGSTGNTLSGVKQESGVITAYVKKGRSGKDMEQKVRQGNEKTLVVFSGELDKAIAAFIIANGAAAMGNKVTMFFTFWGLNILRRHEVADVRKSLLDHMFGFMMPRGTKRLGLSKMNMGGMGPRLIRHVMKSKNVETLEDLIDKAKEQGVRLVACSMSMDVMGFKQEEFIDGVEIGGVAYFLDSADRSNVSMFI